jgi:hypothetical protein
LSNFKVIGAKLKNSPGLQYYPIGMYFSDEYPKDAINTDKKFSGCIISLIFSGAKGKIVAFNKN